MAGPAIRAVELGIVLAASNEVTVATTADCVGPPPAALEAAGARWLSVVASAGSSSDTGLTTLLALAASQDIVVLGGDVLAKHRELADLGIPLVIDLYDPFQLEQLEQARDLGEDRRRETVFGCIDVLAVQAALGDIFLCASPRQRDLWLGQLGAAGRLNPVSYDADPSFSGLLRIVPFGVSATPPVADAARPVLRGVVDGIGLDDDIVLWGGGIYNWFDPVTLIMAIDEVRKNRPTVKLVFMGSKHPNPAVATMRTAVDARALAEARGLLGVHVFFSDSFSDGWIPYEDRGRYLAEATIGISTHHEHVETAYSFRTRILDYFWAGLPVVTTGGDELAALIKASGAGRVVEPGDVDGLVEALQSLLGDGDGDALAAASRASSALGRQFHWTTVAQPLLDFCADPRRAPDLVDPPTRREILSRLPVNRPVRLADRWSTLRRRLATDGLAATAKHVVRRLLSHGAGRFPGR